MDASAGEPPRSTPGEAAAGVSAQASKDAGRRAALFEGAAAAGFRGVVAAGLHVRGVAMRSVRVGLATGLFDASRSGASRGTKRLRRTARYVRKLSGRGAVGVLGCLVSVKRAMGGQPAGARAAVLRGSAGLREVRGAQGIRPRRLRVVLRRSRSQRPTIMRCTLDER